MLAEWSVECSADDPVLVVPWSDPSDKTGTRRFVDLRENRARKIIFASRSEQVALEMKDPGYLQPMLHGVGLIVLIGTAGLMGLGFLIVRKMVNIKV